MNLRRACAAALVAVVAVASCVPSVRAVDSAETIAAADAITEVVIYTKSAPPFANLNEDSAPPYSTATAGIKAPTGYTFDFLRKMLAAVKLSGQHDGGTSRFPSAGTHPSSLPSPPHSHAVYIFRCILLTLTPVYSVAQVTGRHVGPPPR